MIFINILWAIICGICNRIRGGWLSEYILKIFPEWGTTSARLFVSFMISLPLFLHYPFFEAFVFLILLYIGFIFKWSPWARMEDPLHDVICLSLRGLLLTFPAGLYMTLSPFAFCGLLMGIIYYTCWQLPLYHKDPNGYVWNGADWGELFFGFTLGLFLVFCI